VSRVGQGLLMAATAVLVAGCGLREALTPTQDMLSMWSDRPLAPSADLAARATDPGSPCSAGHDRLPVQVLLQDRRTEVTAAFLIAGATTFGSCILTSAGGGSGGGSGPALGAMNGQITIDANGSGGAGGAEARELGGRVAGNAASVVIDLSDGRSVTASIGNSFWLAWWPGSIPAERVVALDAAGAEISSIEVPE
jgi:hypothetical protein